MKKSVLLLVLIFILTMNTNYIYASNNLPVYLDGKEVNLLPEGTIIQNGTTLVPLRKMFEAMGAVTAWNSSNNQAVISYNGNTVVVTPGNNYGLINGQSKYLSAPPIISNGAIYVPLRFITEGLGFSVDYKSGVNGDFINIFTKFGIESVGQDNSFILSRLKKSDMDSINNMLNYISNKYYVICKREEYDDSKPIENLYNYISQMDTKDEIAGNVNIGQYLDSTISDYYTKKYTILKMLAPTADIKLKFKPALYYKIKNEYTLIVGFVDYTGPKDVNIALNNYIKNFEDITGEIPREALKDKVKEKLQEIINDYSSSKIRMYLLHNNTIIQIQE